MSKIAATSRRIVSVFLCVAMVLGTPNGIPFTFAYGDSSYYEADDTPNEEYNDYGNSDYDYDVDDDIDDNGYGDYDADDSYGYDNTDYNYTDGEDTDHDYDYNEDCGYDEYYCECEDNVDTDCEDGYDCDISTEYGYEDDYYYNEYGIFSLDPKYVLANFGISEHGIVYRINSLTPMQLLFIEENGYSFDWEALYAILREHNPLVTPAALNNFDTHFVDIEIGPIRYTQNYFIHVYELRAGFDFNIVDRFNETLIPSPDLFTPMQSNPEYDPRGAHLLHSVIRLPNGEIHGMPNFVGTNGWLPLPSPYMIDPIASGQGQNVIIPPPVLSVEVPIVNTHIIVAIEPAGVLARPPAVFGESYQWRTIDYDRHTQFFLIEGSLDEQGNIRTQVRVIGRSSDLSHTFTDGRVAFFTGDPVDPISGAFVFEYTDLQIFGRHNLQFRRNYNNQIRYTSPLGMGWNSRLFYSLQIGEEFSSFMLPSGYTMVYEFDAATGIFSPIYGYNSDFEIIGFSFEADTPFAEQYMVRHRYDGTEFHFDSDQKLERIIHNGLVQYTFTHSPEGALRKIEGRFGAYFIFDTQPFEFSDGTVVHLITRITDFAGRSVQFVYEGNLMVQSINPDGNIVFYTYDSHGNLITMTDFAGNVILTNFYDSDHKIIRQDVAGQGWWYFEYDDNRVTTVTNPAGNIARFHFDENMLFTFVEHSGNRPIRNTFDNEGRGTITEMVGPNGEITRFEYDERGRQNRVVNPDGSYRRVEFNDNNLPILEEHVGLDGERRVYIFDYDTDNNLIKIQDPDGNVRRFVYADGNRVSSTDRLGNVTQFTYDENGFLSSRTDPLGNTTLYEHDRVGRILAITTPSGRRTSFNYSPAGKLLSRTYPDGITVYFTPDENGLNSVLTNRLGNTMHIVFGEGNRVLSSSDFMGNVTTYTYNASGVTESTTDPLGYTERFTFDESGNIQTRIDRRGNVTRFTYTNIGLLASITDPMNGVVSHTYDNMMRLTTTTDAMGNVTRFVYDAHGRLSSTIDALGNAEYFAYDRDGNLIRHTDRNGNVTLFYYDAEGRMTRTVHSDGSFTELLFDAAGRMIETRNYYGHGSTTHFNSEGEVEWSENADGIRTTFTYDVMGRMIEMTFADGTSNHFEHDAVGNVTRIIDAMGGITTNVFDANGRQIQSTNPLGIITTNTFNARGELIATTDGNGGVSRFYYDGNGNMIRIIDPSGGEVRQDFDASNRLISTTNQVGARTEFSYDRNGNLVQTRDARGNITHFTHDALDRVTAITNALDFTHYMYYDSMGNLVKVVDEEGAETIYVYDSMGRVIEIRDALGNSITNTFDRAGRLISSTDQRGNISRIEYTPAGLVSAIILPTGAIFRYHHDSLGRVYATEDPNGVKTFYERDAIGRIVSITDGKGNVTRFEHDALGRIVTVIDAAGNETRYEYDANGNVIRTTDALGTVIEFRYDAINNITDMIIFRIDPESGVDERMHYIYRYDAASRLIERINPYSQTQVYTYDANGNITMIRARGGSTITQEFDALNRLISMVTSDGMTTLMAYNSRGDLVEISDWLGITSFEFDALGRLEKVNDHNGHITRYEHDPVGNLTSIIYPTGLEVKYTFNELNQVHAVTDSDGNITTFNHDHTGLLLSRTLPNGILTEYSHDILGRVERITETRNGQRYSDIRFEHDVLGNIIKQTTTYGLNSPNNRVEEHVFDALSRLVEHTVNGETTTFAYDTANNLVREITVNNRISFTYNNLNQLITRTDGDDVYTFVFDDRGNMVEERRNDVLTRTFEFNVLNRMVAGTNHETGESVEYLHNSFGSQVESVRLLNNSLIGYQNNINTTGRIHQDLVDEISNENTPIVNQRVFENNLALARHIGEMVEVSRVYILDYTSPTQNVLMSIKDGTFVTEYIYGLGNSRISQRVSHIEDITDTRGVGHNPFSRLAVELIGTVFFHEDLRGSTVRVSDEHGNTVARVVYDAWGRPIEKPVSSFNFAGIDDLINFTGYRYDEVMSVFISRFRAYDPMLRRFISEDPIRYDWNWYAYVGNNPIMFIDPLGLSQISIRQFISDVSEITGVRDYRISWEEGVSATFWMNGRRLHVSIHGGTYYGMVITNCPIRNAMMADSAALSNFFFGTPTNNTVTSIPRPSTPQASAPSFVGPQQPSGGTGQGWQITPSPPPPPPSPLPFNQVYRNAPPDVPPMLADAGVLTFTVLPALFIPSNIVSTVSTAIAAVPGKKVIAGMLIMGGAAWFIETDQFGRIVSATQQHVADQVDLHRHPQGPALAQLVQTVQADPSYLLNHVVLDFDGLSYFYADVPMDVNLQFWTPQARSVNTDTSCQGSTRKNAERLNSNMQNSGQKKPPGSAAHHIVAALAPAAQEARDALLRVGIGINDVVNGVFLPIPQHAKLHTEVYFTRVNEMLRGLSTRVEVEAALREISRQLQAGTFPR